MPGHSACWGPRAEVRAGLCPPRELSLTRADRAPPPGSPQPAVHGAVPTVPTSSEGQPGRRSSPGEAQLGWRLEELTHLVLGGRSVSARRQFSEETGPQAGQGHGCRPPWGPGSLQELVLTLVPPPSGRDPQSRPRIPREDAPFRLCTFSFARFPSGAALLGLTNATFQDSRGGERGPGSACAVPAVWPRPPGGAVLPGARCTARAGCGHEGAEGSRSA